MNSLDNKIKQRFADEALAPSPASQDALWAAIDGQMSGRKRAGILWWTGGIFLAALSFVAAWYYITPAQAQQLGTQRYGQKWAQVAGYEAKSALPDAVFDEGSNEADDEVKESGEFLGEAARQNHPVERSQAALAFNAALDEEITRASQNFGTVAPEAAPPARSSSEMSGFNTTAATVAISDVDDRVLTSELNKLPMLPAYAMQTGLASSIAGSVQPINTPASRAWNLRLHSGPNWSAVRYDSENQNAYQAADMGWGAGIGIDVPMENKLGWTAGLDFNTYYHQFDFERTWQDSVILQNQVLETHINGITGDTVEVVYGDLMAIRTNHRRVLHHNKYQVLSIPLGARYEVGQGGWTAGCALEAALHLRLQAQGRGLNPEGLVAEYSGGTAPQTSVALGWQIRPYLGVQLAPEWKAEVALRYGSFSSAFEGGKTSTRLGGLSLGLVRQF